MFGQDRAQLRQFWLQTFQKMQRNAPLSPLESQIAEVIDMHPEYHQFLSQPETAQEREFLPELGETNPFLHMGLHLGLREQLSTNRPAGLRPLFDKLCQHCGDRHAAEHIAMDCLAECLWKAQRAGTPPQDNDYLACLRRRLNQNA
ncbi:MAG: DUF1841 family protein [Gammaproteobacteria bacterium]|nr:MAG: DUF1841 family protein [Gammaproteobacteria bacterium]